MELDVELGELVFVDDAGLVKVAERTLVNDVANGESLDCFVLRRLASTSVADDEMCVVASVAITAVVAALHSHGGSTWKCWWSKGKR